MSTHPLTLERLKEMKENFDKEFPPSKFDKGADMSQQTLNVLTRVLGVTLYSNNGGVTRFDPHKYPLIGVDIHIVPSIPFGEVKPCRCKEREFTESVVADMDRAARIVDESKKRERNKS